MWRKGNPCTQLVRMKTGVAPRKKVWKCLKKLKTWRRKWQPTPVCLPGESHGRRSLVGYGPRGRKELDMTERLHFHFQPSAEKTFSSVLAIDCFLEFSKTCDHIFFKLPVF